MADGGAQKRPLDDPEDANGGALVAVKKARQEDSLVVASKRPEIKAVSCRHACSTARRLAALPCTGGAADGGGSLDASASPDLYWAAVCAGTRPDERAAGSYHAVDGPRRRGALKLGSAGLAGMQPRAARSRAGSWPSQ